MSHSEPRVPAQPREICLRQEFAELYPEIPVGQWLTAARASELLVSRAQRSRNEGLGLRTFTPRHFEFRGGEPPRRDPRIRTREHDRR
jgi:hypothetical protein